jgi:NAD(P)-dependent dehydrogenase (short-subunit alcohol dehydrogenase family)
MVNNAGISIEAHDPQPLHTTPDDTWDITMRVNARSVFLGTKFAIAQMLKQESHQPSGDRGWIINISSIMGSIAAEGNRTFVTIYLMQVLGCILYTDILVS